MTRGDLAQNDRRYLGLMDDWRQREAEKLKQVRVVVRWLTEPRVARVQLGRRVSYVGLWMPRSSGVIPD